MIDLALSKLKQGFDSPHSFRSDFPLVFGIIPKPAEAVWAILFALCPSSLMTASSAIRTPLDQRDHLFQSLFDRGVIHHFDGGRGTGIQPSPCTSAQSGEEPRKRIPALATNRRNPGSTE